MKKKIMLTIGAVVLAGLLSLTGCTMSGKDNAQIDAKLAENTGDTEIKDIFTENPKAKEVDASELFDKFTAGTDVVKNADSVSIATNVIVNMGGGEEIVKSSNKSLVKREKSGEDNLVDIKLTNQYNEQSNEIKALYKEGSLYFNSKNQEGNDEFLKEAMTYDELKEIINSYELNLSKDAISKTSVVESWGAKEYLVEFDAGNMEGMLKENTSSFGSMFGDTESMTINGANLVAKFDKAGNLTEYTFQLGATYKNGEENNPFLYSVNAIFADVNKTKVEIPEDLSMYKDPAQLEEEATSPDEVPPTDVVPDKTTEVVTVG